ncbi:type IV pilin biogenesis protein [Novipirellula aureliae]|uniref:Type IV pilin biogenesis protein n=1 Tax=Novipirellula aureliae TaxID=2527966 RepID=A0A5C6DSK8_9BACT|nr:type II secretion system F family protein [Novipirellula aureliae]TWU38917.1 type IV pilin biogenesis protein [Novipirellula aureliae]
MSSFFATYLPSFGKLDHLLLSRWRISAWFSGDTVDDRQRSLLRMLAAAHQQRLDPTVLVDNLASEHRGAYRRRLKRLVRRLHEGLSLVDALEQTPDVLSDETVLAIRFATQCGTLDSTYSRLIAGRDETDNRVQHAAGHSTIYASIIGLFAVLVVIFQMTFILPIFLKISEELTEGATFRSAGPLRSLAATIEAITDYFPLILIASFLLFLLLKLTRVRRFLRRAVAGRWIDTIAKRRSANLLNLIADSLEAGRPLTSSLSTLARYHYDRGIRQKLLLARNEVEQGSVAWDSLAEVKLISAAESDAIQKMNGTTDRVWTIRRFADWNRDKVSRKRENRSSLRQPLIVLCLGAIVLWIGYAYFQFLTNLVENLARP